MRTLVINSTYNSEEKMNDLNTISIKNYEQFIQPE